MKIERIKTLKLSIDDYREIYLLFTTEDERPYVNVYTAYKDNGTMNFVYGLFCDDVSDKTKDEDIENEIVDMVMNLVRLEEIQWPEVTD